MASRATLRNDRSIIIWPNYGLARYQRHLLTAAQLAQRLGISRETVRRLAIAGGPADLRVAGEQGGGD
jgi:excisionase family DNA binding protein